MSIQHTGIGVHVFNCKGAHVCGGMCRYICVFCSSVADFLTTEWCQVLQNKYCSHISSYIEDHKSDILTLSKGLHENIFLN